jgi:hypothetical protein
MAINVAGAFKVLIEAQPDKAMAAFDQVLKSTKGATAATVTWADTVTALNSAYQLTTGVVGGLVSVAKTAGTALVSAGSGLVDLLTIGGNFAEQTTQFNNMADAYGEGAEKIIGVIQDITDNTLTWQQQTGLATKALATGINNEGLEITFGYIKKFTEASGQAFDEVSEKFLNAFSTGKVKSLAGFGIDIEKGDTFSDVISKMEEGMSRFGNAGFNAGDKFLSISNSITLFIAKIGEALNASPALQAILTKLADGAVRFTNNFTPDKQKEVTSFFDVYAESAKQAGIKIAAYFGISQASIDSLFTEGAKRAKTTLTGIVQGLEYVGITFGKISNVALKITDLIASGWLNLRVIAYSIITGITVAIEGAIRFVSGAIGKQLERVAAVASFFSPSILEKAGINVGIVDGIKSAADAFNQLSEAKGVASEIMARATLIAEDEDAAWERFVKSATVSTDEIVAQSKRAQAAIASIPEGKLSGFKEIYSGEDFAAKMKEQTPDKTMGGRLLYGSEAGEPKGTLADSTTMLAASQAALTKALEAATGQTWIHQIEVKDSGTLVDTLLDQILARAGVRAKAEGVQVPGL